MPLAPEAQVPKPLTYTLMYHFLWCVLFLLSAGALMGVFLVSGQPLGRALGAPLGLVLFALLAGAGALATYLVRVQILLGELGPLDGFRWSAASSWAVVILVPPAWLLWRFAVDPLARSVPAQITSTVILVELVLWWLSHLLSVRGLAGGRRKLLKAAAAAPPEDGAGPDAPVSGPPAGAALAGEGRT
jgi:hypothetical protein